MEKVNKFLVDIEIGITKYSVKFQKIFINRNLGQSLDFTYFEPYW